MTTPHQLRRVPRPEPWVRRRRGQTVRPRHDTDVGAVVAGAALTLLVAYVVDPSGTRDLIRWLWEVAR
jgi:hypothetical protein